MSDMFWLAVLASGLAVFVIGGPWYGPLFGAFWRRAEGRARSGRGNSHPAAVYSSAFLCGVIAAMIFGYLFMPVPNPAAGARLGVVVGAGLAGAGLGIPYLLAGRSLALLAIDAGFLVIWFGAMGAIFGLL